MHRPKGTITTRVRRVASLLVLAVAASLPATTVTSAVADPCGPNVAYETRDGRVVCSHPDQAPPGVDLNRRPTGDELAERRYGPNKEPLEAPYSSASTVTAASANTIACVGDGSDGTRVQVIYARASNVPDRFAEVDGLLEQYAADVDYQINVSAGLSGTGLRVRYVTNSCKLDIDQVVLSADGDNSFSATRNELRAKGYNRNDRKYLVWVDAAVGICGIAELYPDDRAGAENWNNSGGMFARVDAPCWGYAEAHELLHTIGAVQDSAPHSTDAGHCRDENDTMCYKDTSGLPMISTCPTKPSWHVDCNLDDYFNAAPAPGSYLATHWNSARSIYLQDSATLPPSPKIALSAPASFYAGIPVKVTATATVPEGRTYAIGWSTSRSDCKFTAATGPASTFYCPAAATGSGQITATVVDSLGMGASATKTFTLKKPHLKRIVIAGVSRSATKIKKGSKAILYGHAVDALTKKPIAGMRVSIYYRVAGTKTWKKITTKTTNLAGKIALKVSPKKTTYYRIVTQSSTTWASDRSTGKKISVI